MENHNFKLKINIIIFNRGKTFPVKKYRQISSVFFKFHLKVGVEELIVNALRIMDDGSYVFTRVVRLQSTLQRQL
jgi:hypothetical protein